MNNINSIPLGQLHWQQLKFLHFRRETTTNNNNKINYIITYIPQNVSSQKLVLHTPKMHCDKSKE